MMITYRYYEGLEDLQLQIDFWKDVTRELPFCWKPTLSPNHYIEQSQFHPKSRCFAYDNDKLVGYMSFTGNDGFVSLGYPWVLSGYEGEVQDELFNRVCGFAESEEYGGTVLAQRFRSQWKDQINYFMEKNFEITRRSPLLVLNLSGYNTSATHPINETFSFLKWETIMKKYHDVSIDQLKMMNEYYGSVDFDFAVWFEEEGYFGVTIRPDTCYAEIVAVAVNPNTIQFPDMIEVIIAECKRRGTENIIVAESLVSNSHSLNGLGFCVQSDDVMMVKKIT